MTTINNFDQSSKGVNLELSAFYDCDLSRIYFEESFHVLQYASYSQNSILVFGKHLIDVSDFDLEDLKNWNFEKLNTSEIFVEYYNYHYDHNFSLATYSTIKDLIEELDQYYDVKPIKDCDQETLLKSILNHIHFEDRTEFLEKIFDPKFVTIESRGYSQGDYSEIIIPEKVVNEFSDQTLETIGGFLQSEIDHLLWDAPIYCRLDIDGEEFYFDEYLTDSYDYDKDQMLAIFKDHYAGENKTLIMEWLSDNLPSELEYSH